MAVSNHNSCNLCLKKLQSHSIYLICVSCHCRYHYQCVNRTRDEFLVEDKTSYICYRCLENELPFNHYDDNLDFLNALSELWYTSSNIDFRKLDERVFIPFEINEKFNLNLPLCETDPDANYFNEMYNPCNITCDYHIEDSFIDFKSKNTLSECFSLYHVNARSLLNKKDKLVEHFQSLQTDFKFVCVSETWFNQDTISFASIDGYNSEHSIRSPGLMGGGVSIYIHNSIDYSHRADLSIFESDIETCFIEVSNDALLFEKPVIIGCLYRPPGKCIDSFNEKLRNVLDKISNEGKIAYIAADFNINILNNDSHKPTSDFLELMYSHSFMPLITKPTRITAHTATLIDNIFTNNTSASQQQFPGILYNDLSDHLPIFTFDKTIGTSKRKITIKKRVYTDNAVQSFRSLIHDTDWSFLNSISDSETAYSTFIDTFKKIHDNSFPLKTMEININNSKPWISSAILQSIKTKNKLYALNKKSPSPLRDLNYKKYRNKLNHIIKLSEKHYYQNKFEMYKSNLRKSWGLIKNIIGKQKSKSQPCKEFHINDSISRDPKLITNKFNEYFVGIGTTLANKIDSPSDVFSKYMSGNHLKSFYMTPATDDEVNKIIHNLKDSASGWDEIPPKVIKSIKSDIVSPVTYLCNLSFTTGVVPSALKLAKVVPIYKSGSSFNFTNYRPVSVLCSFSKIYERLVYNRLINFLYLNDTLYKYQFGFRANHSTELALILLLDKIISAIENNEYTVAVFLDLSKAFDMVNHKILLSKLEFYGIRGLPLEWFTSYLSNRKQYVYYNDFASSQMNITCGVPQGSILGPLLFLVFINDLHNVSETLFFILFADDSNLLLSGPNVNDLCNQMNIELNKVVEWFKINKLCLNVKKTNFMIFNAKNKPSPQSDLTLKVDEAIVDQVYHTKFLGVIIDSKLNWTLHINHVAGKISKNIGIITRARKILTEKTLTGLYYTFIYPYLNYCCTVWGISPESHLSKLYVLQKRIVRIISGKPRLFPSSDLFKCLKILPIRHLNQFKLSIFCYKFKMNKLPTIFDEFITSIGDVHEHYTRNSHLFFIDTPRTIYALNSVKYKAPFTWNSLNIDLHNEKCEKSFKRKLLSYLLS